jgi:hypothetical protein
MKRTLVRLLCAGALTTIGGVFVTSAPASAGAIPTVELVLTARGAGAAAALDALTIELWVDDEGTFTPSGASCSALPATETSPIRAERTGDCSAPAGDYRLGIDGLDDIDPAFSVDVYCSPIEVLDVEPLPVDEFPFAEFSLGQGPGVLCYIDLWAAVVAADKIVQDGPADASDFTLQAYDVAEALVASAVDPSDADCFDDMANCAYMNIDIELTDGPYTIDEVPAWGYVRVQRECDLYVGDLDGYFAEGSFNANTDDGTFDFDGDAYCQVTNRYATGFLTVTAEVINDNGGTATRDDVSFEVFRADTTPQITQTACLADGSCYDGLLPIGDYVMGYVGPAGYTVDITQTVIPPEFPSEIITDDPDAAFTMEEFATVEIVITINDPVPATTTTSTTTTTTTLAPTTTVAVTTTTVFDSSGVTLPGTGTSSQANGWMATLALLFVASGGALLIARRRVG